MLNLDIENIIPGLKDCINDFGKLKELVEKWIDMEGVSRGEYNVNPSFNEKLTEIS